MLRPTTCLLLFALALHALSAVHAGAPAPIHEKTLVAWVTLENLEQRGGSVLTLEKPGGEFDAIVFGELTPRRWMPGSAHFARTARRQQSWPEETADSGTLVQVAIVYQSRRITVYRNGRQYCSYAVGGQQAFGEGSHVLIGLRHLDAAPSNRFFVGTIEDARIYDRALTAQQIASLVPNKVSTPAPLAWWDFEGSLARDRMGRFPVTTLVGNARVEAGRLYLQPGGAYLMATDQPPQSRPDPDTQAARIARRLREKLLSDPYRPGYHFVTPEGRCIPFDPNGAIYWKGRYHLFYIYQDERGHNWGHISSRDLFHWRHHPTGLVSGMFSGNCFLNKEGRPTMCYHQVGQGNALAVALDDELNQWRKLPSNPITPKTKPGDPFHNRYRSWDPFGWGEGDTYYAIFGGTRPAVVKSRSLEGPWKYVGDLMGCSVEGVSLNEDVSCPDLFRLGDKYVLLCISHRLGCRYYVGEWKNEKFYPSYHARMSWADNAFFAPESLVDDRGRRIMWAWIFDAPPGPRTDYGWSGTLSLPRVLTLGKDDKLRMEPPVEIERLRYNGQSFANQHIPANSEKPLETVRGNSLELRIEADVSQAKQFGVKVCCSPDGSEQTLVFYDAVEKKLKIDTTRSSHIELPKTFEGLIKTPKKVEGGPFELEPGERLVLRVFVDKSVVEVFANGRQAVMRRIYPSRKDSLGVVLFSRGGAAHVHSVKAWEMMPSNPY